MAPPEAGSWKCVGCGFMNKATNQMCGGTGHMGCKMPKPIGTKSWSQPARASPVSTAPKVGGPWMCTSCGFKNSERNRMCGGSGPMGCKMPAGMAAGGDIPEDYGPVRKGKGGKGGFGSSSAGAGGNWMCPMCGFSNKAANSFCGGSGNLGCKAPKGMDAMEIFGLMAMMGVGGGMSGGKGKGKGKGKRRSQGPRWLCPNCGFTNNMMNTICGGNGPMGCNNPRPEDALDSIDALKASGWVCSCGFTNKDSNQVCGGTGPLGCKNGRPDV